MPVNNLHQLHRPSPGPRFKVDEPLGDFTIVEILGFTNVHPIKKTTLSKKQWWYRVQCSCGSHEVIAQDQLSRRKDCRECANDRRGRKLRLSEPVEVPSELDFARMKLK